MRLIGAAIVALLAGAAAQAAGAGGYTFTTIDPPDGASASANGINDSGQITISTARLTSFLRDPDGAFTPITVPSLPKVTAMGISNSGQVSGRITLGDTVEFYEGFLWNHGQATVLNYGPLTADNNTWLNGTSTSGLVVGEIFRQDHGFLSIFTWHGGVFTNVPFPLPPTGALSFVNGINNAGQIVGSYFPQPAPAPTGFVLVDRHVTELVPPGVLGSAAIGINDADVIVGTYITADLHGHGLLYSDGAYQTIDVPGAINTWLNAINNRGEIVGGYVDSVGVEHAFLAVPEPGLGTLLVSLCPAILIRRRGGPA